MKIFNNPRFLCIVSFVLLVLLILTLAACDASSNKDKQTFVQVKDLSGRTVTFTEPIKRIVTVAASDAEVVCALGGADLIVGRGTYCDYPAEVKCIQDIGSGSTMSVESIVALKPDCVFMSKMDTTIEQVNALESAGIKVVSNQPDTIEQTYQYIDIIGKVIGKTSEANGLIDNMRTRFEELSNKAKSNSKLNNKTIYFEVSPLEYGLWVAGGLTFMDEFAHMLSIQNCFADVSGWAQISQEQVIARNPDYIVATTISGNQDMLSSIKSRPNWQNISAVQTNKVTVIDSDLITRPGPRLVDGAQALYDFLIQG